MAHDVGFEWSEVLFLYGSFIISVTGWEWPSVFILEPQASLNNEEMNNMKTGLQSWCEDSFWASVNRGLNLIAEATGSYSNGRKTSVVHIQQYTGSVLSVERNVFRLEGSAVVATHSPNSKVKIWLIRWCVECKTASSWMDYRTMGPWAHTCKKALDSSHKLLTERHNSIKSRYCHSSSLHGPLLTNHACFVLLFM